MCVFVACGCSLCVVCCVLRLLVDRCLLFGVYCVLVGVNCVLCDAYCLLSVVRCLMCCWLLVVG